MDTKESGAAAAAAAAATAALDHSYSAAMACDPSPRKMIKVMATNENKRRSSMDKSSVFDVNEGQEMYDYGDDDEEEEGNDDNGLMPDLIESDTDVIYPCPCMLCHYLEERELEQQILKKNGYALKDDKWTKSEVAWMLRHHLVIQQFMRWGARPDTAAIMANNAGPDALDRVHEIYAASIPTAAAAKCGGIKINNESDDAAAAAAKQEQPEEEEEEEAVPVKQEDLVILVGKAAPPKMERRLIPRRRGNTTFNFCDTTHRRCVGCPGESGDSHVRQQIARGKKVNDPSLIEIAKEATDEPTPAALTRKRRMSPLEAATMEASAKKILLSPAPTPTPPPLPTSAPPMPPLPPPPTENDDDNDDDGNENGDAPAGTD